MRTLELFIAVLLVMLAIVSAVVMVDATVSHQGREFAIFTFITSGVLSAIIINKKEKKRV